ncbi:hypothetical protein FACS1894166_10250 [Bacilli bacterium]|nr:hypothetical protein FACS1894166_10250 [Bacilli bacterium]
MGWRKFVKTTKSEEPAKDANKYIPGQPYKAENFDKADALKTYKTQPPKKFTVKSMLDKLKKDEIGRPSTYNTMMELPMRRKYVELKKGFMELTKLGRDVVSILKDKFAEEINPGFTKEMENSLDKIANKKLKYYDYLHNF